MRHLLTWGALLATFIPNAWAATPVPPSEDPFYAAPPHFEKAEPGEILRIRTAPIAYSNAIPNCSAAYHVLYRTTDTRYRPSYAITTLFLPATVIQPVHRSTPSLLPNPLQPRHRLKPQLRQLSHLHPRQPRLLGSRPRLPRRLPGLRRPLRLLLRQRPSRPRHPRLHPRHPLPHRL